MKRIAVFCDGTWARSDIAQTTSVCRTFQGVAETASNGVVQKPHYQEGVGNLDFSEPLGAVSDWITGGLFGSGLTEKLGAVYTWLARTYAAGDEIYVFGFSRGAYTARSLVGLIRNCGLPSGQAAQDDAAIAAALKRYRSRRPDDHPDAPASRAFRAGFSPEHSVSDGEREWRRDNGLAPGAPLSIRYLGVWDTVGALGVPRRLGQIALVVNRRYQFHDTALSSIVRAGRHAVAIDERRIPFEPALWSNLDALNTAAGKPGKPYQQHWFPGPHAAVGGGLRSGLAEFALVWVAEGAAQAGLEFTPGWLDARRAERDPAVALPPPPRIASWPVARHWFADRDPPGAWSAISDPAVARWRAEPEPHWRGAYRPGTLMPWRARLNETARPVVESDPGRVAEPAETAKGRRTAARSEDSAA